MNEQMKSELAKPRKMALYADIERGTFIAAFEVHYVDYDEHYSKLPDGHFRELPPSNYVRISDPVDVSFTALNQEAITANAIGALNEKELEIRTTFEKGMEQLRDARRKFLALTHEPA